MKSIQSMLGRKQRGKQARLTDRTKAELTRMAQEAYRKDSSKTAQDYYQMFVNRLRKNYKEAADKEAFYRKGIIESC